MSVPTKIVVGVAGGYLLGRTKKLRLAMALGGALAGRRLAAQRGDLLSQGSKLIEGNPQLKALQGQLTGKLVEVAREAAMVAAASRVEALTKSLEARQKSGGDGDEDQDSDGGVVGSVGSAVGGSADKVKGGLGQVTGAKGGEDESAEDEQPQGEQSQDESGDQPQDRSDEQDESEGAEDEQSESGGDDQASSTADDESADSDTDSDSDSDSDTEEAPAGVSASAKQATPRNVAKKVSKTAKRSPGKGR